MNRFLVDPSWMRCDSVVFAGSPITKFTLTERGRDVVSAIEHGQLVGDDELVRRLLAVGAIHPLPIPGVHRLNQVTAVIPALVDDHVRGEQLRRLIESMQGLARVIVVDDCSPRPLAELPGAELIRPASALGPAGARNLGLKLVTTEFVLFVDTDVTLSQGAVQRLLDCFVSDDIAVVAPRVCGTNDGDVLSRFEAVHSPLDMGEVEANVRKGTRVSYVPSATWLCRTEALKSIKGFDESLRTGEDVDAVWRLVDGESVVRYEPSIVVHHAARSELRAFVTQRVGYGESAAPLASKHGNALAPVQLSPLMLGTWILALFAPVFATVIFLVDAISLTRTLAHTNDERKAVVRLAARNLNHSSQLIAQAITRVWWPIVVALAIFSRRIRIMLGLAALVPTALEWSTKRPALDPVRFTALRLLGDASYGIGVWRNAIRTRQPLPLSIVLRRASRYREGR